MDDGRIGVYLHIPFCERICPYCDFPVVRAPRELPPALERRYVDALLRELERRAPRFAGRPLETVYFGGGTPSLLRPAAVARLLEAVRAVFPSADDAAPIEVTLEMNPGTLERSRLAGFRAAGIDRLSIGVQSFDDDTLKRLGRAHRAKAAHEALAAARAAGFENVSLDLIAAAPRQRRAGFAADLAAALAFGPEHLSLYLLTIESGTPFERAARRGQLALADEDETIAMLDEAGSQLEAAGLARYEVSSFARRGREAQHNRRYWRREAVLGLGVGAWSYEPPAVQPPWGARPANGRELGAYLERIEAGRDAGREPFERLDAATARGEAAFLALRTREGLEAGRFAAEFGAPPRAFFAGAIDELCAAGLLEETARGDLRLAAPRGWWLSDTVFERFVAGGSLAGAREVG